MTFLLAQQTDSLSDAENSLVRLATPDFWLGSPLRILLVLLLAIVLNFVARTIIRKITSGFSRGARTRVIPRRNSDTGWVEDSSQARDRQAQRAQTVGSVLRSLATIAIWTVAILMIISELGFNIAPVIASAGIAGVALSFGAQSLVKDYLAGISMVAEDQLGIGDSVDLGEASGTVESVGLRVTQVRDVQGTLWHVRNGEILRVGNQSQGWARTVLDIPVPYNIDLDRVTHLLMKTAETVRKETEIGTSIIGTPEVWGVEKMSGDSLTLRLAVRTAPLQQWAVARALRAAIKRTLDRENIRMPISNQSVVHQSQTSMFPVVSPKATGASPDGSPTDDSSEKRS